MDIKKVIVSLIKEDRVFCSEADFRNALAWKIKEVYPKVNVHLEFFPKDFPDMHIDIWVWDNDGFYPIELKYKTDKFSYKHQFEEFDLKPHYASDTNRYDFLKDIERIEKLRTIKGFKEGYAIWLTNYLAYTKKPRRYKGEDANCLPFSIEDDKLVKGKLSWLRSSSVSEQEKYKSPIDLEGSYIIKWEDFGKVLKGKNGKFTYALNTIT